MATVNRNARGGIDKPSTRGTQAAPRVTARYTPIRGANAGQRVSLMSDGSKQIVPALSSTGTRGAFGSTPSMTTPTGPVSSDSVLNQRSQQDAMNMAANALVTSPSDGFQFTPLQQQYSQMMQQQQNQNLDMFGELRRGVDLMYDAQLARTNMQYNNLMNDLRADFQKQTDIATQQAAALNPYSQAQGAMTANNFQGAISNKYQEQAARLQEAATVAQNELAAGNAQAYIEITNAMKQSNQLFQKSMMEFMMNAQSDFTKNQQWQQSFNLQKKEYSEGAFMNFVNQFGQDPAFKAGLQKYQTTGVISEGLMPLIERGMEAGLSPAETLSIAQYETIDQRKNRVAEEQFQQQMNLGWYNAATSRMNAVRQIQQDAKDAKNATSTAKIFNTRAQTILDKGREALSKLNQGGFLQTGLGGQLTGFIQASAAGDLESVYSTIRGNISFDQLAQMRAESPTGGALGNVSNFEGQLLMDAEGALSAGLQKTTQISNLTNIMAAYENTLTALGLDAKVAAGEMTQQQANQVMLDNMVTADEVLANFEQQQRANQFQLNVGTQRNSQSTQAVGNYLNSFGY